MYTNYRGEETVRKRKKDLDTKGKKIDHEQNLSFYGHIHDLTNLCKFANLKTSSKFPHYVVLKEGTFILWDTIIYLIIL